MNIFSYSITWLDIHPGASGFFGAVVAITFSAFGFLIKSWLDRKKDTRESLRRVEVAMATSLNQLLNAREQLKFLTQNMRNILKEIGKDTNLKSICLQTVNFPAISEIYNNYESIWYKSKSFYLHNYLLFSINGILATNAQIADFRAALVRIEKKNDRVIDLMMQTGLNAKEQRDSYSENLEMLCSGIEKYIDHMRKSIEILLQIKIYNDHLRGRLGWFFYWKNEGRSFKYFKDMKSYRIFSRNIESCDRIDATIKPEVDEELRKIESRAPQMFIKIQ